MSQFRSLFQMLLAHGPCKSIWVCLFLVGLVGCESSQPSPTLPVRASKDRPALKVWVVEAPELGKELMLRWRANSDQPIAIEGFSADAFASRQPFEADVVIYPGRLLGELLHQDVLARIASKSPTSKSAEDSDSERTLSVQETLPLRWRMETTYGGAPRATPLGCTKLGIAVVGLDTTPLTELRQAMDSFASNMQQDLNATANEKWNAVLTQAETQLQSSEQERDAKLQEMLSNITPAQSEYLIDRFLCIASTTNARRRGIFDLLKLQSRLGKSDFVSSARILARLARLFPETAFASPEQSWKSLYSASATSPRLAIGRPDTTISDESDSNPSNSSEASEAPVANIQVAPVAWSAGDSLLASVGKRSRQSSVSNQFVAWLVEPEQREALRNVCSRVELARNQNDRNNVRDDYRAFQEVNNQEVELESMLLSLRLANGDQYRTILAKSLLQAIAEPDRIEDIMSECAQKSDDLTASLGEAKQRLSQEESIGYRNN